MKCDSCGFEWIEKPGKIYFTHCPVCRNELKINTLPAEMTAGGAVREILKKYGMDILMQPDRFTGLFGDYSPKLTYEKKVLSIAGKEKIYAVFAKCPENGRQEALAKIRDSLKDLLAEKAINTLISIFTEALGWEEDAISAQEPDTEDTSPAPEPDTVVSEDETFEEEMTIPETLINAPEIQKANEHEISGQYVQQNESIPAIAFSNGTYIGEHDAHNRRHGYGKMLYSNGSVYTGEWRYDERWGKGIMKYSNGDAYKGEWKKGFRHGSGKMKYSDGQLYDGEWKDSLRHGRGKIRYPNGDIYEGYWKNNLRDGKGKMTYSNGDTYNGEWWNDKRNGQGRMNYSDGSSYHGEWLNNKYNGSGVKEYSNGDVYSGEWIDGLRHGQGMFTSGGISKMGLWEYDEFKKKLYFAK